MKQRNILIAPLSWGLGHAGRMVPVAKRLTEMGHNVYIGAGNEGLALFSIEAPEVKLVNFPGFVMKYSRFLPGYMAVIARLPLIVFHSFKDHLLLKKLIKRYNINIVISDNRFGCRNKKIRSVYVTHQLRIIFPYPFRFLEPLGIVLHRCIINGYDHCLIPDFPGEVNLTGDLSHNVRLPVNARYTGLLSRFPGKDTEIKNAVYKKPYTSVLLSGPEPQKEILRKKLAETFGKIDRDIIIFEAKPRFARSRSDEGRIHSVNHASTSEMQEILLNSDKIISRPGYTTIMELVSLGLTALIIPTPGQTEQEYLAEYLEKRGWFTSMPQRKADTSKPVFNTKTEFPVWLLKEGDDLLNRSLMAISE